VFYLAVYVLMNLAAFAVIVARERETGLGDDIASLYGLGTERPALAWAMTIAMLALAGFPATAGFFGKLYLIQAAVDNDYAWLGIVIVLGSAISLVYYLRVVAAVWMRAASEAPAWRPRVADSTRPLMAGGAPEGEAEGGALPSRREPAGAVVAPDAGAGEPERRLVRQPEVVLVAVVCALATLALGIYPGPLFDVARDAGAAFTNLI
jgi:NADH-quinone oxidoreductase subunit N